MNDEPLIVDGELLGWYVDQEAQYATCVGVDGMQVSVQTRKRSRIFIPVNKTTAPDDTRPNHVRDAVRANQ
jgi:hypothetical protein